MRRSGERTEKENNFDEVNKEVNGSVLNQSLARSRTPVSVKFSLTSFSLMHDDHNEAMIIPRAAGKSSISLLKLRVDILSRSLVDKAVLGSEGRK